MSPAADPNEHDLYAGIANVVLPVREVALGEGLMLRETEAHVFAPYLVVAGPGSTTEHLAAPWRPLSGGMGFDIRAELHVPVTFRPRPWFDPLNTVWWLLALLRLRGNQRAMVPVVADRPFLEMGSPLEQAPGLWPIEIEPWRLLPNSASSSDEALDIRALDWIREHWLSAGRMVVANRRLYTAFEAADRCLRSPDTGLAVLTLWGALEHLFGPFQHEVTYRLSASIAAFVEPPGAARIARFKATTKLYGARSKVTHGSGRADAATFDATYMLMRDVLMRTVEMGKLPTRDAVEEMLFGGADCQPDS